MNLLAQHTHFFGIVLMLLGTVFLFIVKYKSKAFKPIGPLEYNKYRRFRRTINYTLFAFILHIYASLVYTWYTYITEQIIIIPRELWLHLDIIFTFAYVTAMVLLLRNIFHSSKKYIIFAKKVHVDKPLSEKYKI